MRVRWPAVTLAPITVDLDEAGDVLANFAAKITLNDELLVDVIANLDDVVIGEIARAGIGADAGRGEDLLGAGQADSVDVGKRDLDALVVGDVDAGNSCHE